MWGPYPDTVRYTGPEEATNVWKGMIAAELVTVKSPMDTVVDAVPVTVPLTKAFPDTGITVVVM